MLSESAKVWIITGLMSFMMLIFLLSTYSPENLITAATSIDLGVGSNNYYWVGFFFVVFVAVLVFIGSEYGSNKKRTR